MRPELFDRVLLGDSFPVDPFDPQVVLGLADHSRWRRNQRRASRLPISISAAMNCPSNSRKDSNSPREEVACDAPSTRAITAKSTLRMPRTPA